MPLYRLLLTTDEGSRSVLWTLPQPPKLGQIISLSHMAVIVTAFEPITSAIEQAIQGHEGTAFCEPHTQTT